MDGTDRQGFDNISFAAEFNADPAVFTQVQTVNGADWVTTRQRAATTSGVQVALQEEEALNAGWHAEETVGWFAVDGGAGDWDGFDFYVDVTGPLASDIPGRHDFGGGSFAVAPTVIAGMASYSGPDPVSLRLAGLDAAGATFRAQEDTSADAETAHAMESVSIFAIGGASGLLSAEAWVI